MKPRLAVRGRILFVFLSLGLLLLWQPPSAEAATRTVRVGIFPAAPLVQNTPNKPEGLFIDLVEYFASSLDWRVEYVDKPWAELLADLEKGDIDLLPAVAVTDERHKIYDYSQISPFIDSGVLFTGPSFHVNTIFELQGARVAGVTGSMFTRAFESYAASFGVEFEMVPQKDNASVMQALADGKADVGICIYSLGIELAKKYPVSITAISFSPTALSFAVSKGKNSDLIAGIDRLMAPMAKDPNSVYGRSFAKWITPHPAATFPVWIWWGIGGLCLFGLAFAFWSFSLRRQVAGKTKHLVAEVLERGLAEDALLESRAKMEAALSSMTEAVFISDIDSQFIQFNEAFASFHKFRSKSECAERLSEIQPNLEILSANGEPLPPDMWFRPRALRGETIDNEEYTFRRIDTGETWMGSASFGPFYDKDGVIAGYVITGRDITDRYRMEQALRERDEQLRQSQKMEAVGQLAGGIAHDFNNLLTAILGYGDLLLAGDELSGPAREDVEQIKRAAERAAGLTRQILAFSRRQTMRPKIVSLNEVLANMEPILRRTLGENIDLVSAPDPDLGHVEVDVHQFEQVLMNLALNARDAMPKGGRLTLETANTELDEGYCHTHPEVDPGKYAVLAVSDTGAGMGEDTLSRIFEPFFTTKGPGEGTGLGLATVYGTVKQSCGSISVYSEPGKGTTFKIYLPLTTAPVQAETRVAEMGMVSRTGNETVLVVEDEPALRALAVRVLVDHGYNVLAAGTAAEALQVLQDVHGMLDILVTDLILPGQLQGKELADRLLASRPDLPVVYMSGYTRNAIVHAGRLDKGVHFLEKPFTPSALASMIREVLDQAGASAQGVDDRE